MVFCLKHHLHDVFKLPTLLTSIHIWSLDPNLKLVKPRGGKPECLQESGRNPERVQTLQTTQEGLGPLRAFRYSFCVETNRQCCCTFQMLQRSQIFM